MSESKVRSMLELPTPTSAAEVVTFLGKCTYYGKFIPNLSTIAKPLRDAAQAVEFTWSKACDAAFCSLRDILASDTVLIAYDEKLPLILATDASPYGLGAVLSHKLANGEERPIAYASRVLSKAEKNYSQIDKEALGIVWGVQRFFYYLYARKFTLLTDHKPLLYIFGPTKTVSKLCISRLNHYTEFLNNFVYDIRYKNTAEHANADALSRLISPVARKSREESEVYKFALTIKQIITDEQEFPVSAAEIAAATLKDASLAPLLPFLKLGKPHPTATGPVKEYSLCEGVVLYQNRVVIPEPLRERILKQLHSGHLGIVKMKGLARDFVYWPKIDDDIEAEAKSCDSCQLCQNDPPETKHHWEYPDGPWERIHVDFAGPLKGKYLLIITDAFSKWIEAKVTTNLTTETTIAVLDELFTQFGIPVSVVSDNGT